MLIHKFLIDEQIYKNGLAHSPEIEEEEEMKKRYLIYLECTTKSTLP